VNQIYKAALKYVSQCYELIYVQGAHICSDTHNEVCDNKLLWTDEICLQNRYVNGSILGLFK
jgi:hypothetical protein